MRFHVPNLPHTNTTKSFSWCAYTQKVRKFCDMMTKLGHEVVLYGGDVTEANVTEFVPIGHPKNDPLNIPEFGAQNPVFGNFNRDVVHAMQQGRVHSKEDFICIIGGTTQQPIADAFPENTSVEYGIGYTGVFAKFRVYESYAWMHMLYGASAEPASVDGRFYDTVIPNYFDLSEFTFHNAAASDGYYLYLGRLIDRKGWRLAVDVCERLNVPLVLAGPGDPGKLPANCEYVGVVEPVDRDRLLRNAVATFTPSIYVEPFCGVHVESMLCGTPVITTDWGVFTETVTPDVGFRCRNFREFCDAAEAAPKLNRSTIYRYASSRFSTDAIGPQYEAYFQRLMTLWGDGFYSMDKD